MNNILEKLFERIKDRQKNPKPDSYVCKLLKEGKNKTCKKVGEEATEVTIAALAENKERLISEVADLWFHSLVLIFQSGAALDDILTELERRYNK